MNSETSIAAAVCCSDWFGPVCLQFDSRPLLSSRVGGAGAIEPLEPFAMELALGQPARAGRAVRRIGGEVQPAPVEQPKINESVLKALTHFVVLTKRNKKPVPKKAFL